MDWTKTYTAFLGTCIASITSVAWMGAPVVVSAKPAQPSVSAKPVVRGGPNGRLPGGSRGTCPETASTKSLQGKQELMSINADTTTTTHPTLFFYVPTGAASGRFILRDETGQTVYKQDNVALQGQSGIVAINLRHGMSPSLQPGKRYSWIFALNCLVPPPDQGANPYLQGDITRTGLDTSVVQQLTQAAPRDRVNLYLNAGYWQDALTTLAELRRSQPGDTALQSTWSNLLKSAGLNQIATARLL